MSREVMVRGKGLHRTCWCGEETKLIPLPDRLRELSGEHHLWVHVHNGDTRCYPDSSNPIDAKATVFFDD